VGEVLARLHALPASALAAHPELGDRWRQLMTRSIDDCVAIHRGHGAPETWLAQLPAFFESLPPLHPPDFAPVLLHGDIHSWHLLLAERDGRWSLDGLIDFDSALLGWREYEFAVAMLSFMARRPALLAECLRGYGAADLPRDAALPRRLMAYALLNRYWGLDFMLEAADPEGRCATFDDLERALFR
jgi:hygromycin-B 7''-O-kinase